MKYNKTLFPKILLLLFIISFLQTLPVLAVPITYDITGTLELGQIGSDVPSSFLSDINMDIFGTWTGSITYDVDTTTYSHDVITNEGDIAYKFYGGGITASDIKLNNDLSFSAHGGWVYVGTGIIGPPGYGVNSSFDIASDIWTSGPTPGFIDYMSGVGFTIGGVDANTSLVLPPLNLDTSTGGFVGGTLYFDANGDNLIQVNSETVEFKGDVLTITQRINPVPEPSTMLLFVVGILGLTGIKRKK